MTLGEILNQYPSSILVACTAFAFLWLALYVFRVNPEDGVSKLASGALITVFLYLFSNFMISTATAISQVILYQRALWWLPFAPVLWLHLSQKATQPLEFRGVVRHYLGIGINTMRASAALGAFYGIAALFSLAGMFTGSLFRFNAIHVVSLPLKDHSVPTGPGFVLFAIFMFLLTSIAWINFLAAWWRDSKSSVDEARFLWSGTRELLFTGFPFYKSPNRSQFWWLSLGGILFWFASVGLLVKSTVAIRTHFTLGNSILSIGIIIVAIAILKHNALLKKEALEKDAIYVSIGALGVTFVYTFAVFMGQGSVLGIRVSTLMIIATLALSTHMLADTLKIWFSQLIGTRLGLFTAGDIDKMKQLYHEASRVKRKREPVVELFNDGNKTVDQLLDLLTPRQREIITLRAKGLSDKQIADALNIKLPTVRKHVEDIKNRIGSRDKADCAIYCVVTGLLSKEDLVDWFDSLDIADSED